MVSGVVFTSFSLSENVSTSFCCSWLPAPAAVAVLEQLLCWHFPNLQACINMLGLGGEQRGWQKICGLGKGQENFNIFPYLFVVLVQARRVCPRCRKMLQCVVTGWCTSAGGCPVPSPPEFVLAERLGTQLVCGHVTANLSMRQNLLQGCLRNSCYPLFPGRVIPPFSSAFTWCVCVWLRQHSLLLLTPLSPFLFKWV